MSRLDIHSIRKERGMKYFNHRSLLSLMLCSVFLPGAFSQTTELRLEEENSGRLLFESDASSGAYFSTGLSFQF